MIFSTILEKTNLLLLNTGVDSVFGTPIEPPGPNWTNPVEGISRVVMFGIRMALIIGSIMVLFYLLWGALDWVTGGGDQEKLDKARQKMTNAVIGIILMVAALGIFSVVAGDVLGLIKRDAQGNWRFSLPTIQGEP